METTLSTSYLIAIDGMHCHACERLITGTLSRVPGVTGVLADAQAGTAIITVDAEPDPAALTEAIAAAGFTPTGGAVTLVPVDDIETPAPVTGEGDACPTGVCPTVPPAPDPALMAASAAAAVATATLGIIGMTCSSCQAVIERTLARTPGIGSATVNLAAETA
ncbi:MAG: cation transporter, partial [Actinomycetota bacterium]|nr:cation transporter [Actinomycetota bacterium]